jgi:hypothetical protein
MIHEAIEIFGGNLTNQFQITDEINRFEEFEQAEESVIIFTNPSSSSRHFVISFLLELFKPQVGELIVIFPEDIVDVTLLKYHFKHISQDAK